MSIESSGIYVRIVRVSCVPFFPYTQETPLKIILKISSILGNFIVRDSLHSTRICTIKIKWQKAS